MISKNLLAESLVGELILIFFLAFLSGSEAAILAANRLRARHQAELGNKGAKALLELLLIKEDFLPLLLACETLLTVVITTIGTAVAEKFQSGAGGLLISAVLITLLILSLGEILPKTFATHHPDRLAYFLSPGILGFSRILAVFLRPFTFLLRQLLKTVGSSAIHAIPTEKELKYLISLSREHGMIQQEEEELLQNIFDFTDAKAGEIMIPRTEIQNLEADSTIQEAFAKSIETKLSRFPVCVKDLDHVIGFLDIRDLLAAGKENEQGSIRPYIHPAVFMPESKRVGSLLNEMRKEHLPIALIIDEYGGTAGMVSLTDLLEEIVGAYEEPSEKEAIRSIDERTSIVPASTRVEEIEESFDVSLDRKEFQTVGGLVFGLFGRVPRQGEQIRYQNLRFTVTEIDGYRIRRVMITKEAGQ